MKNITFVIAFLLSSISIIAQDFEGTITYQMVYENLSPQIKPMAGMLPKSSTVDVKGELSKTTTPNAMGGEINVIINSTTGETLTLMNLMGQKYATKMTTDDIKDEDKPEIEYTEETKDILGYTCSKAIATDKEGNEVEVYYTEEIDVKVSSSVDGIKGFPMQVIITQDMFTMTQTVTEIKEGKVKKIKMEVPSDFELKTIEELQKMGGGGM
ncbi:MAG: GLPGLI family protein [Vicingaceae bacterium]|jgi:GLPGLI family protein